MKKVATMAAEAVQVAAMAPLLPSPAGGGHQ